MGFIKSLFGKVNTNNNVSTSMPVQTYSQPNTQKKEINPIVQDVVLISIAENYKVGETKYPDYLRSEYGIGFPNEKFKKLESSGYIRISYASESLQHLKLTELKEIASNYNLKTSGNKEAICQRLIERISEEELNTYVKERHWVVTDLGQTYIQKYPFVSFYIERHKYSLNSVGIDINTVFNLFCQHPNLRVQDLIWGEMNRKSIDYYKKAITSGKFYDYCDLLRTMALFLEEENRYKEALASYVHYLHYRSNFYAAWNSLNTYNITKNKTSSAETLFIDSEILPFIAQEITCISNGCEFDSSQLKTFIFDVISKEQDTGAFTPAELTDFIMCGLNGDRDGQKQICTFAINRVIKQLQKK